MRSMSLRIILAIILLSGLAACKQNEPDSPVTDRPVDVRIVVSNGSETRSAGDTETDNDIRQLRVYAFNSNGVLVGYAEDDNLSNQSYLYITLREAGNIYFYVIANADFGPRPTVDGVEVSDWSSLSATQLQKLRFDLTGFNGWPQIDGNSLSPMSNNRVDEEGNDMQYQNDFATAVQVVSPSTTTQIIPVTVQHVLGRLRLLLNKEPGNDDMKITVTRAELFHRPDDYRLYLNNNAPADIDSHITFVNNSEQLVDRIISSDAPVELVSKPADGYTEIARTFLAPNQHGTYDMTGAAFTDAAGSPTETGKDKAYRLELTVQFEYTPSNGVSASVSERNYTLYLPSVPRNTSIEVEGTLNGTTDLQFNLLTKVWQEREMTIPPFM